MKPSRVSCASPSLYFLVDGRQIDTQNTTARILRVVAVVSCFFSFPDSALFVDPKGVQRTHKISRPRCLRQGLHCTQEGPQSLHVVCSPRAKQVSIFCRTLYLRVLQKNRNFSQKTGSKWAGQNGNIHKKLNLNRISVWSAQMTGRFGKYTLRHSRSTQPGLLSSLIMIWLSSDCFPFSIRRTRFRPVGS